MSDAKMPERWSVGNYDGYMVERDGGDYVEAEDVEPLVAEITRLRAENSKLKSTDMAVAMTEMSLRDEITRLRARVEKLEKVRAAARFLINEDAGVDDPAEDGWWEWEKNCEALRAALKEAKP
jgi:uncharacterized small protein (DUF1192 family)